MTILQLNPSIPVEIIGKPYGEKAWPHGKGLCVALIDYSEEHFTLWKVAMDESGEIYDVPQSHVRLQTNISMGRRLVSSEKSLLDELSKNELLCKLLDAQKVIGDLRQKLAEKVLSDDASIRRRAMTPSA